MKKILVLSTLGMNASLIVTRMREQARIQQLDYSIDVFDVENASNIPTDTDIVLVDPNAKVSTRKLREVFPSIQIERIEKNIFTSVDGGTALIEVVKQLEQQTERDV